MITAALLSTLLAAAPAATPKATPAPAATSAKKLDPKADKADAARTDDAKVAKTAGTAREPSKADAKPMTARAALAARKPAAVYGRATGDAFVAPSMASLGERWADDMANDELGTDADRKSWLPAVAIGVRTPLSSALAVELDGAGTRFSTPVPGGRTAGWVAHAAGRASYDRGRFGAEAGVLVRAADLATPATRARVVTVLPSLEARMLTRGGTETFVAAWNNPMLPYGDEGWLRAGARRDFGRLAGELAVGIDPILEGEKSTGPVLESRLEVKVGKGTQLGLAMRAADEPMAAAVVRRSF